MYDLPEQRSRGARGRTTGLIVVVLAGVVIVFLLVAPGGLPGLFEPPRAPAVVGDSVVGQVSLGVCLDPTASSDMAFAERARDQLAAAFAHWSDQQPGLNGVSARPGLRVHLRTVSTFSEETSRQVVDRTVSPVPALPPAPLLDTPDYAAKKQAWNTLQSQWAAASKTAHDGADSIAAEIRALPLDRATRSAISACLSTAARNVTAGPNARLVLFSDLIETEAPVVGAYGGSSVLIVQSCPTGPEASGCAQRASEWTARLTAEGARSVAVVRADAAATAVEKWVRV